jgi:hypothetical protein
MNPYVVIVPEGTVDSISMDNLSSHPRGIILVRRRNGIPYPYNIDTILSILKSKNPVDPFTRDPFNKLVIERAFLFKKSIDLFPEYKITPESSIDLFNRWKTAKVSGFVDERLDIEAKCFLQISDLIGIFQKFSEPGSVLNREMAESYLSQREDGTMILRPSSVTDSEYIKAYAVSYKSGSIIKHSLVIHRIGEGFYIAKASPKRCTKAEDAVLDMESAFPTIIDLLNIIL